MHLLEIPRFVVGSVVVLEFGFLVLVEEEQMMNFFKKGEIMADLTFE